MSASVEKLKAAKAEALRFIKRADAAIAVLSKENFFGSSIDFAAAKRASLDLTRALAQVRRSS